MLSKVVDIWLVGPGIIFLHLGFPDILRRNGLYIRKIGLIKDDCVVVDLLVDGVCSEKTG